MQRDARSALVPHKAPLALGGQTPTDPVLPHGGSLRGDEQHGDVGTRGRVKGSAKRQGHRVLVMCVHVAVFMETSLSSTIETNPPRSVRMYATHIARIGMHPCDAVWV